MKIENLRELTKEELYEIAREYGIKGRTKMTKEELVDALSSNTIDIEQTQVEASIFDLGTPVIGIGASDKKLPSSLDVNAGKTSTFEKVEGYRIKSPFFDGDPLPESYGVNAMVLMPKNPQWAYAYWEITDETYNNIKNSNGDRLALTIRLYDVTLKDFNGSNANAYFDVELPENVKEWFVGGLNPKAVYIGDIGFKTPEGNFITAVRSKAIEMPSNVVSENIDEEWMIIEEYLKKILERSSAGRIVNGKWVGGMGASGAILGSSEEMIAVMLKRLFKEKGTRREKLLSHMEQMMGSISAGSLSAGSLSAGSLTAGSLSISKSKGELIKSEEKLEKKDFWLKVGTELVVYGATEPDAKVTVMGKEIKLNRDGTFSLRFALPNGHFELPVIAVSRDGDDSRTITPIVDRTQK